MLPKHWLKMARALCLVLAGAGADAGWLALASSRRQLRWSRLTLQVLGPLHPLETDRNICQQERHFVEDYGCRNN